MDIAVLGRELSGENAQNTKMFPPRTQGSDFQVLCRSIGVQLALMFTQIKAARDRTDNLIISTS